MNVRLSVSIAKDMSSTWSYHVDKKRNSRRTISSFHLPLNLGNRGLVLPLHMQCTISLISSSASTLWRRIINEFVRQRTCHIRRFFPHTIEISSNTWDRTSSKGLRGMCKSDDRLKTFLRLGERKILRNKQIAGARGRDVFREADSKGRLTTICLRVRRPVTIIIIMQYLWRGRRPVLSGGCAASRSNAWHSTEVDVTQYVRYGHGFKFGSSLVLGLPVIAVLYRPLPLLVTIMFHFRSSLWSLYLVLFTPESRPVVEWGFATLQTCTKNAGSFLTFRSIGSTMARRTDEWSLSSSWHHQ